MSARKQIAMFGVIVGAVTGLGLTLATLHSAVIVVASAVWGY